MLFFVNSIINTTIFVGKMTQFANIKKPFIFYKINDEIKYSQFLEHCTSITPVFRAAVYVEGHSQWQDDVTTPTHTHRSKHGNAPCRVACCSCCMISRSSCPCREDNHYIYLTLFSVVFSGALLECHLFYVLYVNG